MGLNLKRQRFVNEYLIDGNATQAAARSGYSKATVKQQGSRLLSFVDVKSEIAAKKAEIARRSEVTLDSLSGMFIEDRARASELGQMSAAVSAVDKLARLHGFMVDRSVSLNLNQQMSPPRCRRLSPARIICRSPQHRRHWTPPQVIPQSRLGRLSH